MTRFNKYLVIVLVLIMHKVHAQNMSFPEQSVQFPFTYSLYNPAATGLKERSEVSVLNSFYSGLAENIGMYSLEADIVLSKIHTTGILVFAEQETEYLRRIRTYLRYSYHVQFTSKTRLSAGLALGVFNYFVRATPSSAGASVFAPDGLAGLWINSDRYNLGVSVGQLFGNEFAPINRTIRLGRFLVINGDRKFKLSPSAKLLIALKGYYGGQTFSALQSAVVFQFYDNFLAGAIYSPKRSVGFNLGLTNVDFLKVNGDLLFGFLRPTSGLNPFNSNRFEIALKIYIGKKSEE